MTAGWFVFSVVMPAIVVAMGWCAYLWNKRSLRIDEEREAKAAE